MQPPFDDRRVRAAHAALLDPVRAVLGSAITTDVRPLVAESWRRCLAAGVSPDETRPRSDLDDTELRAMRAEHPLALVYPLLRDVLGSATDDVDGLLAVGDADGRLLWVYGPNSVLSRAERINFRPGARWDESSAGTNAPGTALRLDQPVAIRAAEHFARPVQRWSCVAAPIHDPRTAELLGVVDISGGEQIGSPQTLAMVRAAARMAEAELGRLYLLARDRGAPFRRGTDRPTLIEVSALGRDRAEIRGVGTVPLALSRRHSEMLVLLAEHRRAGHADGLTGDELAVRLYPESHHGSAGIGSTVRAELARLRGLLGPDVIASRPYRLLGDLDADWQQVERELHQGNVAAALARYRGPLLPGAQAPAVERLRRRLETILRAAVLASGRIEFIEAWTATDWGADDVAAWSHLHQSAPPGSSLHSVATAELGRLRVELA
jgi:hypothetical protein